MVVGTGGGDYPHQSESGNIRNQRYGCSLRMPSYSDLFPTTALLLKALPTPKVRQLNEQHALSTWGLGQCCRFKPQKSQTYQFLPWPTETSSPGKCVKCWPPPIKQKHSCKRVETPDQYSDKGLPETLSPGVLQHSNCSWNIPWDELSRLLRESTALSLPDWLGILMASFCSGV